MFMPRQGLTEEIIVKEAVKIVAENGINGLYLRDLAQRLGVKTPALYNHISGIDELKSSIGAYARKALNDKLREATDGKSREDAFIAATYVYRDFARNEPGLYSAVSHIPVSADEDPSVRGLAPLRELIGSFNISEDDKVHFIRALRAALHGFVSLDHAGFMHLSPISKEDSFDVMVRGYFKALLTMEQEFSAVSLPERKGEE
jgi:AcrR family transcriptional regulator